MPSSPLLRTRTRALVIISFFVATLALTSVWTVSQRASNRSSHIVPNSFAEPFLADKGGIVPAAGIAVNSTSDVASGTDGLCTLREAITAANSNTASGALGGECVAGSAGGSDAITFTVTGTINLTAALPDIASDMTIVGPGSSQLTVKRNSVDAYRIFHITSGTVGLSGLTVRDGQAPMGAIADGGGIRNVGTLTMNDVVVTANKSASSSPAGQQPGNGGGVSNRGTLTMTNCVVSGNTTGEGLAFGLGGGEGGGIYNAFPNQLIIINTTISNNLTGNAQPGHPPGPGGGIYANGTLTLTNSTVSNNTTGSTSSGSRGEGGGIRIGDNATIVGSTISGNDDLQGAIVNDGPIVVINSTISGNHSNAGIRGGSGTSTTALTNCTIAANDGVALNVFSAQVTIRNSIIAGNNGGSGQLLGSNYVSQGHNLISNTAISAFVNGVNGDQVGSSGSPIDAHLGPLADNGGLTRTQALLSTSTALDAGDDCVTQAAHCGDAKLSQLLNDQRGFSRIVDGPDGDATATVDIGAYEMQTALANLPDTITNEDTPLTVTFDAGDASTITSVTASSSDPAVVPNDTAHLSVAMTGSTGVIKINPATNAVGPTNITVTVNRTVGGPDTKTFLLTVIAVNDAPSFTKGADQSVNEDAGAQTVNNWATGISAGPANESGQTLTFQITNNSNPALFSVAPAVSPAGTLTYTPVTDANGSATITFNLKDNGGAANGGSDTSTSQTFTITVTPVNDAPSFIKGANQTVNEDAGAQSVVNWATNISRGPADESGQALTFTATNDNNALFSTQPSISSTGTLTYTPTANASGTATVTVTLKDNGGIANGGVDTSAAQTFTITVNAVNDAPSFTKGPNQTVNEDAGAQTVNNWATAISAGPANEAGQTLTFQVTGNTNAALFSAAPAISSSGTLTYTPAAETSGSATITINLKDDGGTANGGVDTSASTTFTITVNSVNDAPSFTKGADQTVSNSAGAQTVPNWATNISSGPANESGQTLTFQVTGITNAALFSVAPAISSTGTLTYTPAPNMAGFSTITIRLQDSGGTANGGVDTSVSQSFVITVNAAGGSLGFNAASYNTTESSGSTSIIVKRTGDLTRAVTVDYRTSDGNTSPCSTAVGFADPKCDFTSAIGTLSFAVGEDTKTVNILISQDSFVEGPETFSISLFNPTNNATVGSPPALITIADDVTEPATNPIDDVRNFVRQHYHDFLSREPDQSGWDFWTDRITSCGSDVQCNEVRRIDVSASFFLSIEFQQSGYLVERFYKVGYGDATGTSTFVSNHQLPVPIVQYNEFIKDTQRLGQGLVVLQPGWEQVLENNKQAYALEFVQTARFISFLPTSLTPTAFVDRLNQNSGGVLSLSERQAAIDLFGGAGNTINVTARAKAVRMVAEDTDLYNAEFNRAFVLAEYFGYLRRNPNDAPDTNYTGYDFWLTKLNQFNGSYVNAEMVKAFLSSIEYRQRFGP